MYVRNRSLLYLLVLFLGMGSAARLQALTLDWSNVTWTSGSLSGSIDVDGDGATDVTVAISGATGLIQSGYPAVTQNNLTGQDALDLTVNFKKDTQTIVVTVNFVGIYASGVTDVNFTLQDVDRGAASGPDYTFVDQISSIKATSTNGSALAATITTSANNTSTGTGTNTVVFGTGTNPQNSTGGNVGIDFGTNTITAFTFSYGNQAADSVKDPAQQSIGLFDVKFRKIPEAGVPVGFSLGCLGLVAISIGRRWKGRRREAIPS